MGDFRNVSKQEPCPICGKSDWCSIFTPENPECPGEELHVCRRAACSTDVVSPLNGQTYAFVKELRDGSCMFEEASLKSYCHERWLEKNGRVGASKKKTLKVPKRIEAKKETLPSYIPPLPNHELDRIHRRFLSHLSLNKTHYSKLAGDGWSYELIRKNLIRSIPSYGEGYGNPQPSTRLKKSISRQLVREFGTLEGVPGFYLDSDGNWTFFGKTGMLIPLFDAFGNLFRLRLRLDRPEVDEDGKEKMKYKNFSSYHVEKDDGGNPFNVYEKGTRSGSHLGVYMNRNLDDCTVCFFTEGEKKGIFANDQLHHPVVSIPGVNSFGKLLDGASDSESVSVVDYLKEIGCKIAVVAYDADKATNRHVLHCEERLIALLMEQKLEVAIAQWNPAFGKGLDDILKIGVRPNLMLVR